MNETEALPAGNMNSAPLPADLADLLAQASLAAYTDYATGNAPGVVPPPLPFQGGAFNFLQRFTGFDDVVWGSGREERYALIYQSSLQRDVYLIAFRGTDSIDDMVLDLESAETTAFAPFKPSDRFPNDIAVGDGFNKIYSTKNPAMSASLQAQLFAALNGLPIPATRIFITGHSLGGALASLFALDMAVSLPAIATVTITYASPRVGKSAWQTAYNDTYALKNKTIRIRNSYDLVPKAPPAALPFAFCDVGNVFAVSYSVTGLHLDLPATVLSRHALANYQYVVSRATPNSPQTWVGSFVDQAKKSWGMQSYNPNSPTSSVETAQDSAEVRRLMVAQKNPEV